MQCLKDFGEVSGYKVNEGKSEAMMIKGCWPKQLDRMARFRWSKEGFRYLGVILTHCPSQLYKANYVKLLAQIKNDLERWDILPLSLVGRVETIRMNVLPRLLFLFCSLPVTVPVSTFKALDRLISKFIWQNKRPRVRLKVLCALRERGGLALPHFRNYYWASQLRILVSWIRVEEDTKWVGIEQSSLNNLSISVLPFLDSKVWRKLKIQNEWVNYTLKVWEKFRKVMDLPLSLSRATKISSIYDFLPAKLDTGFVKWAEKGLVTVDQLFEGTTFRAFSQLQTKFGIAQNDMFRYFQIRHYLLKHKEWDKIRDLPNNLELFWIEVVEKQNLSRKRISSLYNRIRLDTSDNTLDIKGKWELEANIIIADDEWVGAWVSWRKCLSSPSWREFSWKLRMRFFRTPLVISGFDKKASPLCWRGCGLVGDFSHIFWDCPLLKLFWENVLREIGVILGFDNHLEPQQVILGDLPLVEVGENGLYLLRAMVLIAHKMITVNWLKPHPPTLEQWTQRLKTVNCMENITAKLQLRMDKYLQRWAPVIMYLMN